MAQDSLHAPAAAGDPGQGLRRIVLGASLPAGWVVHDLAVVLTAGRPQAALELLPTSLLVLVGGAVFGALARGRALVGLAALGLGLGGVLPNLLQMHPAQHLAWLPRALFLLVIGFAVARRGAPRLRLGHARTGLVLGILACALVAWVRDARDAIAWPVVAAGVVALAIGLVRRPAIRRLATAAVALAPALAVAPEVARDLRPMRPDLAPPGARAWDGAPNVLLVILDTVRADHLGCYGYGRATTPALDRWASEHFTRYTNARSTSSWTLPSHASLFTGLFPAQHGAAPPGRKARPVRSDVPTLAEHLRAAGYRTAGIMSNNVYLRAPAPDGSGQSYGLQRGFEHFDDRLAGSLGDYLPLAQLFGRALRVGHLFYRDGGIITDLAIEWLDRRPQPGPFFLALNYMDVHSPNVPPAPYDHAFGDEQPRNPLAPEPELQTLLYDRELAHLDHQVDRLLRAVEERGLWNDTAVVITSDHGEALGDHGFLWHGWVLYEAVTHVPLLVKPPGGRSVEVVDGDVSGADVFYLLHELVGADVPPPAEELADAEGLLGELYVNTAGDMPEPAPGEPDLGRNLLSWKDGSIKTIVSSKGAVEAYDLARDPHELEPLELGDEEIERARQRSAAWWTKYPVNMGDDDTLDDPEALARMRALGYLGDSEDE